MGNHSLTNELENISHLTLILCAVLFSLSLALAVVIAYHNYSPIRSMAKRFGLERAERPMKINEIQEISDSFGQTLQNNQNMKAQLSKMQPIYTNYGLLNLLSGMYVPPKETEELCRQTGISFENSSVFVCEVKVRQEGKYDYKGNDRSLVHAMISNVSEELFRNKANVYFVYSEGEHFYGIFSLPSEQNSDFLVESLQDMHSTFLREIGIDLRFTLSDPVSVPEDLSSACTQAQTATEFAGETENQIVTCYQEVHKSRITEIYFPIDEELKLLNTVRSGDSEKTAHQVRILIDENLCNRGLDGTSVRFFLLNLCGTLLKSAQQVRYDLSISVENMPRLLENFHSVEEIREYFISLFVLLSDYVNDQRKGKHQLLIEHIISYVAENYSDSMLNVSTLSEQMKITPSYLSTIFKEYSGANISDYIHKVRIQKAKILLEDPSLTLSSIAKMTGYLSDISFLRSFKKYEGITPGAYRTMHQNRPI